MNSLKWQEQPQKNTPRTAGGSGGINPWFGIAMGLIGLIVGVGVTVAMNSNAGISLRAPSQEVAQVPSAQPTPQQAPAPKPAPGPLPPVDFKTDHIRGNPKATVAVVEYSDFECPFCIRLEPTLTQISKEYGDKVMIVYRHFPLGFHANAPKEAEATECANELGGNDAFWSYHDKIFERTTGNGTGFPLANLVPLAKELGLNETAFKSCLDSGKYAKHVADEMAAGQAAGVSGTPGNFIVNLKTEENVMISGAQPFANFKQAIDSMLQ
jgi:protein-disulfide isomerase